MCRAQELYRGILVENQILGPKHILERGESIEAIKDGKVMFGRVHPATML